MPRRYAELHLRIVNAREGFESLILGICPIFACFGSANKRLGKSTMGGRTGGGSARLDTLSVQTLRTGVRGAVITPDDALPYRVRLRRRISVTDPARPGPVSQGCREDRYRCGRNRPGSAGQAAHYYVQNDLTPKGSPRESADAVVSAYRNPDRGVPVKPTYTTRVRHADQIDTKEDRR